MRILILIATLFVAAPFARYLAQDTQIRATFYPNGNIRSEIETRRNLEGSVQRQGQVLLYHEQGGLQARGRFDGDRENGRWEWFTPDGELEAVCDYDHGRGIYRRLYPDGSVMQEGPVVGEAREGHWKEYYPSGRLRLEGTYRADRQHGTWTAYTDEDVPRSRSVEFVDGVQKESP